MVLLMVVYIAKIYADCLYRFSLDCQTASTDVYTSHSLGIHACALGSVRMAIFVRTVGSRGKVIELRKGIRADSLASLLPVRRAHFTVLVLPMAPHQHSIHHNEEEKILTVNWNACTRRRASSTDRPTGRSFIVICLRDRYFRQTRHIWRARKRVPEHTLRVNQVARAERDALVLDQTPVVARHTHVAVSEQRNAQVGSEPASVARLLCPRVVRVLRVGRYGCHVGRVISGLRLGREKRPRTKHCSVETRKFGERVVEREDFGWTHKGEVTR
jgi:hypothetical protein